MQTTITYEHTTVQYPYDKWVFDWQGQAEPAAAVEQIEKSRFLKLSEDDLKKFKLWLKPQRKGDAASKLGIDRTTLYRIEHMGSRNPIITAKIKAITSKIVLA